MNGILTACYLLIALNFKVESKVDKIVKFFKAENADWWSIVKTYLEGYTFSGMCRNGDTVSMVRTPLVWLGPIFNCILAWNFVKNFIVKVSNAM